MPPPIKFRRLHQADRDEYRRVRLDSLANAPDSFGALHEIEAALPLAAFGDRIEDAVVLGAFGGARLVGIANYKRETSAKQRHKAAVHGVYVDPAWRRHGLAAALMTTLIEAARTEVEQLTLTVTQGNQAAIALYQSLGFRIYGVEPRAYSTAIGYRDSVLMALRLRPD